MTGNKMKRTEVLQSIIMLALPTVFEQLLSTLMQYVDTAMVGHLGERATASVSVTTSINWLVGGMSSAFGVAVLAMTAKFLGSGDGAKIKQISHIAVVLVIAAGVVFGSVSVILSPFIPMWMGAEEAIWKDASRYFLIISIPLIFRVSSIILGSALRAVKDTKTPMVINTFANGVNVLLNAVFIYLLGMGVTGAAIATAVSYTCSGLFMYRAYQKNQYLHWEFSDFRINRELLVKLVKISLPILATNVLSSMGYVVFAGMVSNMGTTIFAAHSIAITAEQFFYIPGYGVRTATSTLVGIAYGQQDREKFKMISHMSMLFTIGIMLVSGLALYILAYPLMSVFTNSTQVAALGAKMLRIVAFTEPFFGLMVVSEGIFHGLGKPRYTLMVEGFSMWGIRILFAFIGIHYWNFGLEQIWYCMIADNIFKACMLAAPVLIGKNKLNFF